MKCKNCKNYKPKVKYESFNEWLIRHTQECDENWTALFILFMIPIIGTIITCLIRFLFYYQDRKEK